MDFKSKIAKNWSRSSYIWFQGFWLRKPTWKINFHDFQSWAQKEKAKKLSSDIFDFPMIERWETLSKQASTLFSTSEIDLLAYD